MFRENNRVIKYMQTSLVKQPHKFCFCLYRKFKSMEDRMVYHINKLITENLELNLIIPEKIQIIMRKSE